MTRMRCGQSRGFVLLWTLALLVLVAVVLGGIVRRSTQLATQAVDAREQLQAKWAMASCRQVLLPAAESLLQQEEKKQRHPLSSISIQQQLGDVHLRIEIADEQAKINLNSAYAQFGPQRAASLVRSITRNARSEVPVLLNPDPRSPASKDTPTTSSPTTKPSAATQPAAVARVPPFGCWSQIFDAQRAAEIPTAFADLTCWGDGRLNLRRASPEAARAFVPLFMPLASVQHILQARVQSPNESVSYWLKMGTQAATQPTVNASWITDTSACHSISVYAQSGGQTWHEMTILAESSPAVAPMSASTQPSGATSQPSRSARPERTYRLTW